MFAANTPIWIPDAKAGYVEGFTLEQVNPGQHARVLVSKTQTEVVLPPAAAKQIERRVEYNDENADAAPDDLSSLVILSKASLLEALRLRSASDKVYTRVGPILVSVNPYKTIPDLYTETKRALYFDFADPSPHVYETAARAFIGATKNNQDQSIIFSGESGAGKTFATRILTEFLVYASSRSETRSQERAQVQQRLQSAQPLIEAFGNAKTTRNENSSRFGCWTEIEFAANEISAARVVGFNLEKSRVCLIAGRGATEDLKLQRNFHIFYQVIASNPKLATRKFRYLGDFIADEKAASEDKKAFTITSNSIEALGLTRYMEDILKVVEGVLLIGNIEFEASEDPITKEETCRLINKAELEEACSLLCLDADEIERGMIQRDVSNPKEVIWRPHSKIQAEEARDALAKHIYGRLFDWLLVQINAATNKSAQNAEPSKKQGVIGLLDTYGFEIFATNSFEQLCINYCNERIMANFNETCIKAEHELYKNEGLVTNPVFISDAEPLLERSRQCLELFESMSPLGIFALLDDVVRVPKGTDDQFLYKLREEMKSNAHLVPYVSTLRDSKAKTLFGVVHFAGTVHYCVDDFVEKNRDTLHAQLDRTCCASEGFVGQQLFAQSLFSRSSSPRKKTPTKSLVTRTTSATQAHQKLSLGARFRFQLNDLMNRISQTQTHFVRCIKPNDSGSREFNGPVVLEQLAYGGVLETCRLRKDGFQVRRSHDDFLATYKELLGASAAKISTPQELADELRRRYGVDCQVGKTTAFLRAEDFNKLEKALIEREEQARVRLQSFARLIIAKNKHSKRKLYLDQLAKALESQDEALISSLLEKASQVFPGGEYANVPLIKQAKDTLNKFKDEERVCGMIRKAIENMSLDDLEAAAQEAKRLNHDLRGKVAEALSEANVLLEKWRAEKKAREATAAKENREKEILRAVVTLQKAAKRFLYKRRVQSALEQLRIAVKAHDVDRCQRAIRRLSDLGLRDHPEVIEAMQLLPKRMENKPNKTQKALQELQDAYNVARTKAQRIRYLKPEDVALLTLAINRAREAGCPEEECAEAIQLEQELLCALGANHAKAKARWWLMCCCTTPNVVAADSWENVNKPKKIA